MGANAQTSVPLYVAAEVLTAADMNISAGTGVPVFATTVTRDAAFGGAGEKVLAEGQLAYIEASNIVQYYDGAAWATVGPAAAGGLVCVKAETAFSAVSSFTADNVFTSSYSNYKIIMNFTGTTSGNILGQFRVGGVAAATNYNYQRLYAFSTTVGGSRATAQTSFQICYGSNGSFLQGLFIELTGPQLAQATNFYALFANSNATFAEPDIYNFGGNHTTATAYDGIGISISGATMTGTYAIYGYAKTV